MSAAFRTLFPGKREVDILLFNQNSKSSCQKHILPGQLLTIHLLPALIPYVEKLSSRVLNLQDKKMATIVMVAANMKAIEKSPVFSASRPARYGPAI